MPSAGLHGCIPDWTLLTERVHRLSTNPESGLHGVRHWQCVAWAGAQLLRDAPKADPAVVLLFALFHDSMRLHDGTDRDHGRRGGRLARQLQGSLFHLSEDQMVLLQAACYGHEEGSVTSDPTAGVCWDADRLNLWRIGVRPNPALLCTEPARRKRTIEWARDMVYRTYDWATVFEAYELAAWQPFAHTA
jgi:uncharacterized protein